MRFFRPLETGQFALNACRIALLCGNALTFIFSAVIISLIAGKTRNYADHVMLDPRMAAGAICSVSLITSLIGCAGAAHTGRLTLIVYIFTVIVSLTLTLYLGVLCFLTQNTHTQLSAILSSYVGALGRHALETSGALCVVGSALMAASAVCAAAVAGAAWTRSKMPALLNLVNFVMSAILLSFASYAVHMSVNDNTIFAVFVGASNILGTLYGTVAIYTRWRNHMLVHATSSLISGFLGSLTAAACIAAGNVKADWCNATAQECQVEGHLSADRLLLLGAYAVIASVAFFAEAAAVAQESLIESKEAPHQELQVVYDQFVGADKIEPEQDP
jgi:hypothetical protein